MPVPLPNEYKFLNKEEGPRILLEAIRLYGVVETPGPKSNETIINWAKEVGDGRIYSSDEIPWCGLFVAVCAARAGIKIPDSHLWALSWSKWGNPVKMPQLGDVVVFTRETAHGKAGHVGIYVGEDKDTYHIIGGNQSDQVCIRRFPRSRVFAVRQTPWKFGKPANVRRIIFNGDGMMSSSEA